MDLDAVMYQPPKLPSPFSTRPCLPDSGRCSDQIKRVDATGAVLAEPKRL